MGFFNSIKGAFKNAVNSSDTDDDSVALKGRKKNTGGYDHRGNKGDDRTPAQKEGDRERRK